MPANRTLLIVAGMHRSGTSLFTAICHHLGAALGSGLASATVDDNKIGYWEPQAVIDLHEAAFASMGLRSDDCKLIPEKWWEGKDAEMARQRISRWLKQFPRSTPLIAVKDPRICRFLPLWNAVAGEAGLAVKYVLPWRNPLEVAQSQQRRLPEEYANIQRLLVWWLLHVLEAERYSRNYPRIFYGYGALLQDWHGLVQQIAEMLEFCWPLGVSRAQPVVDALLDPTQHRNRVTEAELADADPLGWASDIFSVLKGHETGQELPVSALDKIASELEFFLQPLEQAETVPHGLPVETRAWEHAVNSQTGVSSNEWVP